MTKTKHKPSRKGTSARSHAWVLALVIILIIIAVVAVVVCLVKPQSTSSEPSEPATSDQSGPASIPDASESPDTSDDSTVSTPEAPEKTPQYEGEDPNTLDELTGVVTYKGVENGTLIIMTMLNQYLHQTGICVITLTGQNFQSSYTASVDAHGDATASYCENFEIPTSVLASDTYNIEIKLTGDGKTGTIRDEVKL